jgi:hypothetical protein
MTAPFFNADRSGSEVPTSLEALEARFAHKVGAKLSESVENTSRDVAERLRASREQAIAAFKNGRQSDVLGQANGSAVLGGLSSWWKPVFSSALPVVALISGLWLMDGLMDDTSDVAEIDLAILKDPLPPAAYADAGFLEFLKSTKDD